MFFSYEQMDRILCFCARILSRSCPWRSLMNLPPLRFLKNFCGLFSFFIAFKLMLVFLLIEVSWANANPSHPSTAPLREQSDPKPPAAPVFLSRAVRGGFQHSVSPAPPEHPLRLLRYPAGALETASPHLCGRRKMTGELSLAYSPTIPNYVQKCPRRHINVPWLVYDRVAP